MLPLEQNRRSEASVQLHLVRAWHEPNRAQLCLPYWPPGAKRTDDYSLRQCRSNHGVRYGGSCRIHGNKEVESACIAVAGCSRTDPELRMAPNSDAAYVSLSCRMSTLKMEWQSAEDTRRKMAEKSAESARLQHC